MERTGMPAHWPRSSLDGLVGGFPRCFCAGCGKIGVLDGVGQVNTVVWPVVYHGSPPRLQKLRLGAVVGTARFGDPHGTSGGSVSAGASGESPATHRGELA